MRVMDLTGRPRPLAVEIEAAPAYEFVTSLHAFGDEDLQDGMEVGKEWADAIRAQATPDLVDDVLRFSAGGGHMWSFLWSFVYESPAPKDVASFLTYLRTIDPITLRLRLLGEDCPPARKLSRDLLLQVAHGDAAAVQTYLDHLSTYHGGKEHAGLHAHVAIEPEQDKVWLLSILTRWYAQVFQSQEADLAAIIARDGAAKRRLARQHPPERLIELATNGLRYDREPNINRVLLIPTVLTRPWVLIWEYGDAVIFCHAVADESLSATPAPSPSRLVKIYKALADERRLRALQLIATGDHTLQELADSLGIGKSLMHHHVVALRAAGLVRVRLGHERHFEVRAETLAELPEMLRAFLTQQPGPASV